MRTFRERASALIFLAAYEAASKRGGWISGRVSFVLRFVLRCYQVSIPRARVGCAHVAKTSRKLQQLRTLASRATTLIFSALGLDSENVLTSGKTRASSPSREVDFEIYGFKRFSDADTRGIVVGVGRPTTFSLSLSLGSMNI